MKREIKFRGRCSVKSKYKGEWVIGNVVIPDNIANGEVLIVKAISDRSSITYYVDADTVGQYTGLKDRFGNEIYEGDIMKFYNDKALYVVMWYKEQFVGARIDRKHRIEISLWDDNLVVIGNVHDNPELLEGIKL